MEYRSAPGAPKFALSPIFCLAELSYSSISSISSAPPTALNLCWTTSRIGWPLYLTKPSSSAGKFIKISSFSLNTKEPFVKNIPSSTVNLAADPVELAVPICIFSEVYNVLLSANRLVKVIPTPDFCPAASTVCVPVSLVLE